MANDTVERPSQARRRSPLTWVVVGISAVAAAIGLAVAVTRTGSNPPPADQPTVVLHLTGPQAGARCMAPSPERLASMPLAFAGTVETVKDGTVTLTPAAFYAGGPADLIELRYPDRIIDGSVEFTAGESVRVAAAAGRVVGCGFSGTATEDLVALYSRAFGE